MNRGLGAAGSSGGSSELGRSRVFTGSRILACVLAVLVLTSGLAVMEAAATPSANAAPATGGLDSPTPPAPAPELPRGDFSNPPGTKRPRPKFDPAKAKLVDRRADADIYLNPDGTRTERVYGAPMNWRDPADGKFKPINAKVVADGSGGYRQASGPLGVRFAGSTSAAELVTLGAPGRGAGFSLAGAATGKAPSIDGSKLTYAGVGKDIDLQFHLGATGFKELVVLNKPLPAGAPTEFSFPLRLDGLTPRSEPDGGIGFYDADGIQTFVIPAATMWDSAIDPRSAEPASAPVQLAVSPQGNSWKITVSADPAWLSDPARKYPIFVDPSFYAGETTTRSDAYTTNAFPANNYNSSYDSSLGRYQDRLGYYDATTGTNWSYLQYGVSPANGTTIIDATWSGYFIHSYQPTTRTLYRMQPVAAAWSASTLTWNNQPGLLAGYKDDNAMKDEWRDVDVTDWVQNWASGTWANNGIRIDTAGQGQTSWKKLAATENTDGSASYIDVTYDNAPVLTSVAPAAGIMVTNTTPTLTATATDADGDPLQYWFRVSTGAAGTNGRVADSGWVSSSSWQVPAGVLQDGAAYHWVAYVIDGMLGNESAPRQLTVDLRLGEKPAMAYDSAGPVQVNLANGNAVLRTASPSFASLGGGVGLSYTYNSQTPSPAGLTGSYFDDPNHNAAIDPGEEPSLVRRDPQVSFNWGSGNPVPAIGSDYFTVRWNGFVTVPSTGTYSFGATYDDRVKVTVNTTTVLDQVGVSSTPVYGTTLTLNAGQTVPITVDYAEGIVAANVALYAKALTATPPVSETVVPASWLSATASPLPQGWMANTDLDGNVAYTAATPSDSTGTSVSLVDSSGAHHIYTKADANPNGGYTPPKGEDGVLARDASGGYSFMDDDGMTYAFAASGHLTSASSSLDDRNPAAALYQWTSTTGSPARLTTITDPVADRKVHLYYGGDSACPLTAPTGLQIAPLGLLCQVSYTGWDGTATKFFYTSGRLARIEDPGGEITDFGYDANGRLDRIRDPLGYDAIQTGSGTGFSTDPNDKRTLTVIEYDSAGRVARVIAPAPAPTAATWPAATQPIRTYDYSTPTQTRVNVAGLSVTGPAISPFLYGSVGDKPVIGDWDGNGSVTAGVYRPSNLTWYLRNSNSAGTASSSLAYGDATDLPVAGDWNGGANKAAGIGQFRAGSWYLRNADGTSIPGFAFGAGGDIPVVGDWDGNGTVTIGLYRPSTLTWYLRNTNSSGGVDVTFAYGNSTDRPVAGDWDGNGTSTIGVQRGSSWYLRNANGAGASDMTTTWGGSSDVGVAGDFNGDGRASIGSVTTAGPQFNLTNNLAQNRTVDMDAAGRWVADTDATGRTTTAVWADDDRLLSSVDPSGRKTSHYYDYAFRKTNVYGPAPTSCFYNDSLSGLQNGAVPNGSCTTPAVARTQTEYDQNITGLAAAYWDNNSMAGAPKLHRTGVGDPSGALSQTWTGSPDTSASPVIPADNWSARFTGEVQFPNSASFTFQLDSDDHSRLYVDDVLVVDQWTPGTHNGTGSIYIWDSTVPHRIRVDLREDIGSANIALKWSQGSAAQTLVPGSSLRPRYGLVTTTTTYDAPLANKVTTTAYAAPENGLATSSTVDPGTLALTTSTAYDTSALGFLRRSSRTLPAGNSTTYGNYLPDDPTVSGNDATTRAKPAACGGGSAVNQGGLVKRTTGPDPDGAGTQVSRVGEVVYDSASRVVASRTDTLTAIDADSAPWACTTFDDRGRVLTQTVPAMGAEPSSTITYNYAVGANPLVTSVTDNVSNVTITTTTDLLGRVVSYSTIRSGDGSAKTTTSTYDLAGRFTDSSGPVGAQHFDYDGAGRLLSQKLDGAIVAVPVYDAAGQLTSVSYSAGGGNGTSLASVTRDQSGAVTSLSWAQPGGNCATSPFTGCIARDSVVRSQSGRVRDETLDGADLNAGDNFLYDGAGRLTQAWVGSRSYQYGFETALLGCGTASVTGKNANRTAQLVDGTGCTTYAYDAADRLTASSGVASVGNPTYDAHGNTLSLTGQTFAYDGADRHVQSVAGASTVRYVRDATDRIVERKVNGTTIARYGFSGDGDTPDFVTDAAGTVIERSVGLPGGVTVTKRTSGDVWSYPNIHGDVMAVTNSSGIKQGNTMSYDPYGQALGSLPDNSHGNYDYGWLGGHQRGLEHEGAIATIEMGARQYVPGLGRFLEVDPIEGGSCNDYDYVCADPINQLDLDGEAIFVPVLIGVGVVVVGGAIINSASKGAAKRAAQQRRQAAGRKAQEEGARLLKGLKRLHQGRGQGQSGRSGSHGADLKKVGAQLIRDANKLPVNDPLREALKREGQRYIKQGNSINHPGGQR